MKNKYNVNSLYPYSGSRAFGAYVTESILSQLKVDVLLDLGAGRGGNLDRMAATGASLILIDRNYDASKESVSRARSKGIGNIRVFNADWDAPGTLGTVARLLEGRTFALVATHSLTNNYNYTGFLAYANLPGCEAVFLSTHIVTPELRESLRGGLETSGRHFKMVFPEDRPTGFHGKVDHWWDFRFDVRQFALPVSLDVTWFGYDPMSDFGLNTTSTGVALSVAYCVASVHPIVLPACVRKTLPPPVLVEHEKVANENLFSEYQGTRADYDAFMEDIDKDAVQVGIIANGAANDIGEETGEVPEEDRLMDFSETVTHADTSSSDEEPVVERYVPPTELECQPRLYAYRTRVKVSLLGVAGFSAAAGTIICFDLHDAGIKTDVHNPHCSIFFNREGYDGLDLRSVESVIGDYFAQLGTRTYTLTFGLDEWGPRSDKLTGQLLDLWKYIRRTLSGRLVDFNKRDAHVAVRLDKNLESHLQLWRGVGTNKRFIPRKEVDWLLSLCSSITTPDHVGKGDLPDWSGAVPRKLGAAPWRPGPRFSAFQLGLASRIEFLIGFAPGYFNVMRMVYDYSITAPRLPSNAVGLMSIATIVVSGTGMLNLHDIPRQSRSNQALKSSSELIPGGLVVRLGVAATDRIATYDVTPDFRGFEFMHVDPNKIIEVIPVFDHDHKQGKLYERVYHAHYCEDCGGRYEHEHAVKDLDVVQNRVKYGNWCDECSKKYRM